MNVILCEQCGTSVHVKPSRLLRTRFCSVSCRHQYEIKDKYRAVSRFLSSCSGLVGCWEWPVVHQQDKGYGRLGSGKHRQLVHRIAWEISAGESAGALFVLHNCDNPPCCRPDHLFLGTGADNMADKMAKGRHRALSGDDHRSSILTQSIVDEIRNDFKNRDCPTRQFYQIAGHKRGVRPSTIRAVVYHENW